MTQAGFRYRAATTDGSVIEGTVDAADERSAIAELRRQALIPVSVEAATTVRQRLWTRAGNRHDDVATAVRTLSAFIGSGAPLDRALNFSAQHASHPEVSEALRNIRAAVQNGATLAAAFTVQQGVFGSLAPAMIRAGEESGALDTTLAHLADHYASAREFRVQLQSALLYPALMGVVAVLGVTIMLTFVVPRFVEMLGASGASLPLTTRMLVATSRLVVSGWWFWALLIIGGATGARMWRNVPGNLLRWHAARLRLPVVGALEEKVWTARLLRSLGILLRGGAPLLSSLRIARDGVGNVAFGAQIDRSIRAVERGDRLASALSGAVPPLAAQLLAVGEESGTLDDMALRTADTYEGDVRRSLASAVALLEPVLIIVFGALVAFIALAMLQAVYSINASIV